MSAPERLAETDRDRAAADLGQHYASGRLSGDDFHERLDALFTARTRADVAVLLEDLPAASVGTSSSVAPRRHGPPAGRAHLRAPLFALLALLVVVSVLTRVPFVLVPLVVGGLAFAHRRSHLRHPELGRR